MYILGNPPFVGSSRLTSAQQEDRENIFEGNGGELDYVACWYKKAADYIDSYKITCAFVSTNSICQGQQVAPLWGTLHKMGIHIDFAHTTFVWSSESVNNAHVHCVIVGFSKQNSNSNKRLFNNGMEKLVSNINGYLVDAPDVVIEKRRKTLCDVPPVVYGLKPADNGNLCLSNEDKEELIAKEPQAEKWIRPFITAREYINGDTRWCLWLKGISPAELKKLPHVRERVEKCRTWREQQTPTGDAYKLRETPALMRPSSKFHNGPFMVFPLHTGHTRKYIPIGFEADGAIPGNSVSIALDVDTYHFGVIESNVHMAWMRAVAGRLKTDYRYGSDIVYNNFPWPTPTPNQKVLIKKTAQAILDARALYPDSSLADLYDPVTMPPELLKAHRANDKAVMQAYGFWGKLNSESECVAELMKMYEKLTHKE